MTVVFAQRARSESKRCKTVKRVKGDLSEGTAPMWRETIVFDYDDEPLQFVRFKLCVCRRWPVGLTRPACTMIAD